MSATNDPDDHQPDQTGSSSSECEPVDIRELIRSADLRNNLDLKLLMGRERSKKDIARITSREDSIESRNIYESQKEDDALRGMTVADSSHVPKVVNFNVSQILVDQATESARSHSSRTDQETNLSLKDS